MHYTVLLTYIMTCRLYMICNLLLACKRGLKIKGLKYDLFLDCRHFVFAILKFSSLVEVTCTSLAFIWGG